jgi:hypothetical protein
MTGGSKTQNRNSQFRKKSEVQNLERRVFHARFDTSDLCSRTVLRPRAAGHGRDLASELGNSGFFRLSAFWFRILWKGDGP